MMNEMFVIDRSSKLPLYHQIERNIRQLIISGKLETGEMAPSELELAQIYGVSRLTIRKALDELVRQNWLARRQGVGTFVTKPSITTIAPSELSFTSQMLAIGKKPSSTIIQADTNRADHEVANALRISEGDAIFSITRVRLADDQPILYESTHLSIERFPGIDNYQAWAHGSLYQHLLVAYQVLITRLEQTLKPVLLSEEQARHLKAKVKTPSILSICLSYNSDSEPIEYATSVSNGELSEFYFTFRKVTSKSI